MDLQSVWVHNDCGEVNGNSKQSTKPQHRYEIEDTKKGDLHKTGISGQPLNQNGSSPRANSQVRRLNREAGYERYKASVPEQNIPDRSTALESEYARTKSYFDENGRMPLGMLRPKIE